MAGQVQCPNCGGYKVIRTNTVYIDPETGREIKPLVGCSRDVALFVVFSFSATVICYVAGAILEATNRSDPASMLVCIIIVLATLGGIVLTKLAGDIIDQWKSRTRKIYTFECNLCGYSWEWHEGQHWPEVHVRPDLIVKGEQRLEEQRQIDDDYRRRSRMREEK